MQAPLFEAPWKPQAITLRQYQAEAEIAVWNHLRTRDDNPVVVIPTGGGKTPIIATLCRRAVQEWKGRVIVLAHVKELLEQAADKLVRVCPGIKIGVYSAGLGRKDTSQSVIVAGIQSVYKRACDLDPFDLAIVDESHLIPPDGEGMYRQFLVDAKVVNPKLRVIGLTATPFRLSSGPICTPDGLLNSICYEIGVRQLIVEGYLSPLISKNGQAKADLTNVHVRGGEFVAGELELAMENDLLVDAAVREIVQYTQDRKAVLIFTAGVAHGRHVCHVFKQEHGIECGFVTGDTPDRERAETLDRFQRGDLKYLANVNVLTTGFDAPHIDCVALLRPTMSPGLYYQMVGRGFRLHAGKANCLVLDFGGNVERHGPVDLLCGFDVAARRTTGESPTKECPKCHAVIAAGYSVCPQCGHEFPPPEREKHDGQATDAGVLSGQVTENEYEVSQVRYSVHRKRNNPDGTAPPTMRVDYFVSLRQCHSEWICFEHSGFAYEKACRWWKARSPDPVPQSVEEAVAAAEGGALAATLKIVVRSVSGEKFDRIVNHTLDVLPEPLGQADRDADKDYGPPAARVNDDGSLTNYYKEEDIPF